MAMLVIAGATASAGLARRARRIAVLDRIPVPGQSRRRLPVRLRAPLRRLLADADVDLTPEHAAQLWMLAAVVGVVCGTVVAPVLGVLVGTTVVVAAPLVLRARSRRRGRLVAAAVPEMLEHVASEMRSGGTVATAVARLASDGGALAGDLRNVDARVQLGASMEDALAAWTRERRVRGVAPACGALALAHDVGGRAADALEGLASSLRSRAGVIAEARALSAQARASALVVGVGPVGYLVFSSLIDGRAVHALVSHPVGRMCATAGLALEALGAWWMRRILASAEPA